MSRTPASMSRCMTDAGHSDPAMIPVRTVARSWTENPWSASISSNIAMNIVGTP